MEKKQIKEMVAQEMEQIRQWCSLLECHLVEVVSKWQEQVGYQSEHLKVYYSNEDLKEILCLESDMEQEKIEKILSAFCMLESRKMGELQITNIKKQYCIDVPKEGCDYAAERLAA